MGDIFEAFKRLFGLGQEEPREDPAQDTQEARDLRELQRITSGPMADTLFNLLGVKPDSFALIPREERGSLGTASRIDGRTTLSMIPTFFSSDRSPTDNATVRNVFGHELAHIANFSDTDAARGFHEMAEEIEAESGRINAKSLEKARRRSLADEASIVRMGFSNLSRMTKGDPPEDTESGLGNPPELVQAHEQVPSAIGLAFHALSEAQYLVEFDGRTIPEADSIIRRELEIATPGSSIALDFILDSPDFRSHPLNFRKADLLSRQVDKTGMRLR